MRAITKGREPAELVWYRSQPGALYDGCGHELVSRIREALLAEQGYICAYCMQRIDVNSMKVEHWHSQTRYPAEQLDYRNMLGCCSGNEGSLRGDQHCDTFKADKDISLNPAERSHHQRLQIRFGGDGVIYSGDSTFNDEINRILNLNQKRLKKNRRNVFDTVVRELSRESGPRTRSKVQKLVSRWSRKNAQGHLQEYFEVALYLLKKKLERLHT